MFEFLNFECVSESEKKEGVGRRTTFFKCNDQILEVGHGTILGLSDIDDCG